MAQTPTLHAGLASHQSFRQNLYHAPSASRVSELATSNSEEKPSKHDKHDKHKSHRHRHHSSRHDKDKEHRHSSSRRHAREVVQSAIQLQPPTSFGDLLKQARGSKDTSPSHSRKGSIAPGTDGNVESKESRDVGVTIPPRRPLRPEDVELERKRVEARERDLRTALKTLSDQSLKTSRRLDDTYYSILEKVSVLRQTIGSLQELSGLTKELHDNFESDTKELIDDVRGQYDGFDSFDNQQQQLVDLEERIHVGKQKADSLTHRLAKTKERVDARAQSEQEWAARKHPRILWAILGSIAALVFALILFHQLKPIDVTHDDRPTTDFASRAKIINAPIPDIAKQAIIGPTTSKSELEPILTHAAESIGDDDRLRVFDEL
ncbi:hypothetical protein SNOG_04284 [Parastagonospora nodorum SN15]|uniref:Uncharacterized protein n=1 Tax=Phaeosphaeria nodorum (strain SN15 / ATCC MYA-4574 / FGSC 10173) TaxID=321614 RepID=Q0UVD0_PHANO|nr:hypothetical protein SNOG_04284 [Parastagonospora nodorum SN15]EAT88044.2 hypothetical protein SNOG_04284 [Parastagonospora nodorum SN15]